MIRESFIESKTKCIKQAAKKSAQEKMKNKRTKIVRLKPKIGVPELTEPKMSKVQEKEPYVTKRQPITLKDLKNTI